MKKTFTTLMALALVASMASTVIAGVKKNDPDKKEVEKILKETGETHYVEKMKVSQLCSMKVEDASGEDTYFHVYNVTLRKGGYRIVIFDNTPNYLGYYATEYEAADYEEGAILLDSGDSDEDGNTTYYTVPLPSKGPATKVRIDGVPTSFVKNPKLEAKAGATAADGSTPALATGSTEMAAAEQEAAQYREWKITMKGKTIPVRAKFISYDARKKTVTIKNEKGGVEKAFPASIFSDEDKEYLKTVIK